MTYCGRADEQSNKVDPVKPLLSNVSLFDYFFWDETAVTEVWDIFKHLEHKTRSSFSEVCYCHEWCQRTFLNLNL